VTADRHAGLVAIAGPVSRETFSRLETFEAEFRRWSQRINLAAPSTLPELWERHVLDSAQVMAIDKTALQWLDLGSGGGFPGAVIAILLAERAGAAVSLVESNRKKAAFLLNALGKLQAPARVYPVRIEEAFDVVASPQIVTARALAPLGTLLGLASPWLTRGAKALFHKGRDYRVEIDNAHDVWRFDLIEHPSVIGGEGAVLEIANLRAR